MEHASPDLDAEAAPETVVVSFVLRFVCHAEPAEAGPPAVAWHGTVRHVQSNTERRFTRWEDAVAFLTQYIVLKPER